VPAITHTSADEQWVAPRRLVVSALLLGIVGLGWLILRGSWPDDVERLPTTAADGPITQLYRAPDGRVQVRGAIVLSAPPALAWETATDYANHETFLPFESRVEVELTTNAVCVSGLVDAGNGEKAPFSCWVHLHGQGGERTATWAEANESNGVNRGEWRVKSVEGGTLVVLTMQIEFEGKPAFLVRNILMNRMPQILQALRAEVDRRHEARP
jgi:Polyketide cyclase / dehydrase and lipid transport